MRRSMASKRRSLETTIACLEAHIYAMFEASDGFTDFHQRVGQITHLTVPMGELGDVV